MVDTNTVEAQPVSAHPYAWIAPDGKFYPVEHAGHWDFAKKVITKALDFGWVDELEDQGWLHISDAIHGRKAPTQAQLDTMFDWMVKFSPIDYRYKVLKDWVELQTGKF